MLQHAPVISSGQAYRSSLKDGRSVYFDGERIEDLASHPRFSVAVDLTADSYDRDAAVLDGDGHEGAQLGYPRSVEDLRRQVSEFAGTEGSKDMTRLSTYGGLLGMEAAADRLAAELPVYAERIRHYVAGCRRRRIRCVPTITDAKGDRTLGPSKQPDPDLYLRIVSKESDGVVLRGAKLHIRGAAILHELLVLPTKQMKEGEDAWAVACAVPVSSPGLKVLNVVPGARFEEREYFPYSWDRTIPVGFVVFDDVFVPWERVFLCGETHHSSTFVHSFGIWDRISSAGLMEADAHLYAGIGQLLAEANGIQRVPHIRDKIVDLVLNATMVSAGIEAAISNASRTEEGFLIPAELYTNAAKYYASTNMPRMMMHLHDIAGGSLINTPLPGDLRNPDTGGAVRKYMQGPQGMDGEYRTRLMYGARDVAADAYTGHWEVAGLHGAGGPYAQRLVARKHYNMERSKQIAMRALGLAKDPADPDAPDSLREVTTTSVHPS
jgi:4-hydroxybutyryl-CoA dehydratase/vinylacetyl-CoA-Delta-isomerase